MVARKAKREDPDQTASLEAVLSGSVRLSRLLWQATTVGNFRTFTQKRTFTVIQIC